MNQTKRQLPYAYWLDTTLGVGKVSIQRLLNLAGTPEEVYHLPLDEVEEILTAKQMITYKQHKKTWNLYTEYERLEQQQIRFLSIQQEEYPTRLRHIPDAPYAIYVKGALPEEEKPTIAIIGARQCSAYGRFMAREFGMGLAKEGIQVISGLAMGVDSISQKGAMEAGGRTFGVLGCGVDICYPQENQAIYDRMLTQGGILSEYIPGTSPKPNYFPPRNRIISGLSDAVLVVEAKARSGTLITVDMALEQGKEVYALPGRTTDALSFGCNHLIQQGAGIALSVSDFITELREHSHILDTVLPAAAVKLKYGEQTEENRQDVILNNMQKKILQQMDEYPQSVETIYRKILEHDPSEQFGMPLVLQELVSLQMREIVAQKGAFYYLTCNNRQYSV
ncbi:MAG: DNA-processing protein DprA [Lachnospiraceae bacterium]